VASGKVVVLDTADWVLLIILIVILAIVVYIELRYMRSRNRDYIDRTMDKDDTFNAISTTKAIATTLKQKGKDTREAEHVIVQAEQAYKRGNFIASREFSKKARDILMVAPTMELATPKAEAVGGDGAVTEKERKTVHEVKKMEPNMLESNFIISACRDLIQEQEGSGKDLCSVKEHLSKADALFAEKKYNEALKEGMVAKRMLGDDSIDVVPEVHLDRGTEAEMKCPGCGTTITADDVFCRKCGMRLASGNK
jgi:hypothetical protein